MEDLMSAYVTHQMTNHHESALALIGRLLRIWQRRYAERTELAHWTDRDLNDVGLSRDDVEHEIDKPFWRA